MTNAALLPEGRHRYYNNDGTPAAGGKVYTYAAGTTTPKTTFADADGVVPLANPIVLDAKGEAVIFWSGSYKVDVKQADGQQVTGYPVDNLNTDPAGAWGIFTALAGAGGTALVGYDGGTVRDVLDNVKSLSNYAALRAYTGRATGVRIISPGVAGVFTRDDSDTTSADNGGTILVATNGKRWKRTYSGPVNVVWFGAVADGTINTGTGTDNAAAFAAAIAASNSIYVPAGVFKVSSQLLLGSGKTLYGDGKWTSFILAPSTFNSDGLIKCNGAGGPPTNIRDVAVVAQNGGAGASSIGINSVANGTFISGVWASAFKTNVVLGSSDNFLLDSAIEEATSGGTGVLITCTDVTVANCVVYHCYIGISVANASFVDGVVAIDNVRSMACTYDGINVLNSSNVNISNCSVGHNNTSAYSHAGIYIFNSSNVAISNFIARLGGGPSTSGFGVFVDINTANVSITGGQFAGFLDGIRTSGVSGLTISGTICKANYRNGITVAGGDQVIVTGNNCSNNGSTAGTADAGIYSDNTSGYSLHSIVGNLCVQGGGGPQNYGIYANVTDNGAASGYSNISSNTNLFNVTAQLQTAGVLGNIKLTGNL